MDVVEGADNNQEHLEVDFGDVFPDTENDRSELSHNRDDILRVVLHLFVTLPGLNDLSIDDSRADCFTQIQQESAIFEALILKACDLSILDHPIGPFDEIRLSL